LRKFPDVVRGEGHYQKWGDMTKKKNMETDKYEDCSAARWGKKTYRKNTL